MGYTPHFFDSKRNRSTEKMKRKVFLVLDGIIQRRYRISDCLTMLMVNTKAV